MDSQLSVKTQEFSLKPHQGFLNLTDTLQQFSKSYIAEVTLTGLTSIEPASIQVKTKDSFGLKSILTNSVFLLATLFKILSLSISMLSFDIVVIWIIPGLCLLMIVCKCCCSIVEISKTLRESELMLF